MSSFSVPSWLLRSASWKECGLNRRLLDSVAFGAGIYRTQRNLWRRIC